MNMSIARNFAAGEDTTAEASDVVMEAILGPTCFTTMTFGEREKIINEKLKPLGYGYEAPNGCGTRFSIGGERTTLVFCNSFQCVQFIYERTVGLQDKAKA